VALIKKFINVEQKSHQQKMPDRPKSEKD